MRLDKDLSFCLSQARLGGVRCRSDFFVLYSMQEDHTSHSIRIVSFDAKSPVVAYGIGDDGTVSTESSTRDGIATLLHRFQATLSILVPKMKRSISTYNPLTHSKSVTE